MGHGDDAGGAAERPRLSDLHGGILVAGATRPPGLAARAAAWARGRNGWVRLPLLLWFAYILHMHLQHSAYESLFAGLNLGIHELGHFVFAPLGQFLTVAGGTILQLTAPVVAAAMFRRQGDYFAIAVAACWLSTNLFSVARYAGDARSQALPLVSPTSGDPLHDWHFMLGHLGLLRHDADIAGAFHALAIASMVLGLAAGAWLVWHMLRPSPAESPPITA